jgi:hypothetical protein
MKGAIDPAILEATVPKAYTVMQTYDKKLQELEAAGDLPYCLPMPVKDHTALLDHAEQLLCSLGAEPYWLLNLMLIMKSPHEGRRFWHTDCPAIYAPSEEDAPELFVLYFLQKTTRENGALLVMPGYAEGPQHSERVTTPFENEYAIETEPGDVIIFDPRLLHGSLANSTDKHRFNVRLWIQTNWKERSC